MLVVYSGCSSRRSKSVVIVIVVVAVVVGRHSVSDGSACRVQVVDASSRLGW